MLAHCYEAVLSGSTWLSPVRQKLCLSFSALHWGKSARPQVFHSETWHWKPFISLLVYKSTPFLKAIFKLKRSPYMPWHTIVLQRRLSDHSGVNQDSISWCRKEEYPNRGNGSEIHTFKYKQIRSFYLSIYVVLSTAHWNSMRINYLKPVFLQKSSIYHPCMVSLVSKDFQEWLLSSSAPFTWCSLSGHRSLSRSYENNIFRIFAK